MDGWFPAKEAGLSRRYLAENLSVAKWLEERRQDEALNLLLVVDPTDDLDAAREEGERIKAVFSNHPAVNSLIEDIRCIIHDLHNRIYREIFANLTGNG